METTNNENIFNNNLKVCEVCLKLYDYWTEPKEVREWGNYICSECWNDTTFND